jgi:hypothetical protein
MDYASDPEREAERDFCEEVLWLLGSHHRRGDFDRLVVAAEPRMLGLLRDRRSREIAAATVAEVPKDYLHLAPAELRARLRELVPGPYRLTDVNRTPAESAMLSRLRHADRCLSRRSRA